MDQLEVLRKAVTDISISSCATVSRIQDATRHFHQYLLSQSSYLPRSLYLEFDLMLDAIDKQVHVLNENTHDIAIRIREKGGSVVDELGGENVEQSVVGRAAAVPLGELKVMLDELESGHGHEQDRELFSRPPPLPPEAHCGDPATKVKALLAHMQRTRDDFFLTHSKKNYSMSDSCSRPEVNSTLLPARAPSPPSVSPPSPQELKGLREERKNLETELLAAHKAIGALEAKLRGMREASSSASQHEQSRI